MASLNKCILIALIGSVMMTAVLAQSSAEIPDVAGDAGAALKGAQNVTQKAAQGAQENVQKATNGILGLGSKLYNTGKDLGSSILAHIPFVGGENKTDTVSTTPATVEADKKEEQVTTPVTEVQTDGPQGAAVEEQQQQVEEAEKPQEQEKEAKVQQ